MINRFAHRLNSVMARDAITHDSHVVEECGRECGSPVTTVALLVGWEVIERFTHGDLTVMAARAGPEHLDMIHPHDRHPGVGLMAGVAAFRAEHVLSRLGTGLHPACLSVTSGTKDGRTCEDRVDMTAPAGRQLMGTVEPEASGEVVELRGQTRLSRASQREQQH